MDKFNVDDLIQTGLVKVKQYEDLGLRVLKYHRKVFYKNLWGEDARLLDCRGTVIDEQDTIISMPFTKVFNYKENNTEVEPDRKVTCVRKINGFMAAASMYNGDLLVSTTGTLDSSYVEIAKEYIGEITVPEGETFLFEICSPDDPHIIQEQYGAYLIGIRSNYIGSPLELESTLDHVAIQYGFMRPEWFTCSFGTVLDNIRCIDHEGYMVRDAHSGEVLCKIKSPHYLVKKFFMRIGERKLDMLWDNAQNLRRKADEEYYPLIDYLTNKYTKIEWGSFNEHQRRVVIEGYFNAQ